jgi:hypothetical protein
MLTDLPIDDLTSVAVAFVRLSETVAGVRRLATRATNVTFGPTAAAKTMYALRPNACAPWDDPIRHGLVIGRNDAAYLAYLSLIARALTRISDQAGVAVADLPRHLGRPESSPPKLMDEYLSMRVTRASVSDVAKA